MHKSRSPAACWRLTEVLLLLQRPLSEACSLLIIQFAGCRSALRVLCPQPSVIAYHFTFFHVWPRLILLLIFSIFSWDNRPQCRSLRPRVARPLQLPQLPGEISSICAQGPKTSHSDRAQAASGTSLLNKRSGTAWPSVPTQCLLCLTIHYKWKVPQKLSWSQLACVLAYECFSVSLDLMLLFFSLFVFHVCQRDCQMNVEMEIYWQWPSYFEFFGHFIFLRDVTDWSSWQFVIMPVHLSSSVQLPIVICQQTELISEPGLVVFGVVWDRQTDRQLFTVCKNKKNIADIANSHVVL